MRRSEKEVTNKRELEEFLSKSQVIQIAITVPGGAPYIVPLNFVYDNNSIFVHSATVGRKIDLLKDNPLVGFCINEMYKISQGEMPCSTGTRFRSVTGTAEATFLTDKAEALRMILDKYTGHRNAVFADDQLAKVAVIRMDIIDAAFKADIRGL